MAAVSLQVQGALSEMLLNARCTASVPSAIKSKAEQYHAKDLIPFREAQSICTALRAARGGEGPWLHELTAGSRVHVPPAPERIKCKELQERLTVLKKEQEDRQYKEMVADITKTEMEAEAKADPGVNGYKESMGFGLNAMVMSGVFYLFFLQCGKRLSSDKGMHQMYGILGMFLGLALHVLLLTMRTSYSIGSLEKRRRMALLKQAATASMREAATADSKEKKQQ